MYRGSLTDVKDILVGHYSDPDGATGCTVVLTPNGARASVSVQGSAPGSRELALLEPGRLVDTVHGVVLSGGSAFGLAAADGVMRWLEEHGYGFETGMARVPIVPAAVLYDLGIGTPTARPTSDAGYMACSSASNAPVTPGNVGVGTGATVGKLLGPAYCMKGGLGSASCQLANGITIATLVAVNAMGDVIDPSINQIIAGTRHPEHEGFLDASTHFRTAPVPFPMAPTNTTLGVVATDAMLNKTQLRVIANMAHDGLARTINPVHTQFDGDTIFALSTGDLKGNLTVMGAVAADLMAEAVVRAMRSARPMHGIPSAYQSTT